MEKSRTPPFSTEMVEVVRAGPESTAVLKENGSAAALAGSTESRVKRVAAQIILAFIFLFSPFCKAFPLSFTENNQLCLAGE
jgi:hypothetical protein